MWNRDIRINSWMRIRRIRWWRNLGFQMSNRKWTSILLMASWKQSHEKHLSKTYKSNLASSIQHTSPPAPWLHSTTQESAWSSERTAQSSHHKSNPLTLQLNSKCNKKMGVCKITVQLKMLRDDKENQGLRKKSAWKV